MNHSDRVWNHVCVFQNFHQIQFPKYNQGTEGSSGGESGAGKTSFKKIAINGKFNFFNSKITY